MARWLSEGNLGDCPSLGISDFLAGELLCPSVTGYKVALGGGGFRVGDAPRRPANPREKEAEMPQSVSPKLRTHWTLPALTPKRGAFRGHTQGNRSPWCGRSKL